MEKLLLVVLVCASLVFVTSAFGGYSRKTFREDDTTEIIGAPKSTAKSAKILGVWSGAKEVEDDDYDGEDETDAKSRWKEPSKEPRDTKSPSHCVPAALGGVDWLLSVRQKDYGWKEDTHRAVIVLAVNGWGSASREDIRLMEHQLEVELTKAYVKNSTSAMYPNDLALYIHALIAIGRNPQNYFGIDWASDLENRVANTQRSVHPFLLLALCNANRVTDSHLYRAKNILQSLKSSNDIETLSHALNAYECMASRDHKVDESLIGDVRSKLLDLQLEDGSFGNVYTTSLVVQALASNDWDNKRSALDFLRKSSTVDVNMVSTYYIQLALNADKIRFIKDLQPDLKMEPAVFRNKDEDPFIQYTIRNGKSSNAYFTITIRMAPGSSFFDIMKLSALQDSKFNFSHSMDKDDKPVIYSISDIPNDIEDGISWKLCVQTDINHDRHQSKTRTVYGSPAEFFPNKDDHVLYWYRRTSCENA